MKVNVLVFSILLILGSFSMQAVAGGNHSHDNGSEHAHKPVNKTIAKTKAKTIVENFVKKGLLDESWKVSRLKDINEKMFSGKKEWVVTFFNGKVKDKKKRKLFLFLTISGDYIAANYTGK